MYPNNSISMDSPSPAGLDEYQNFVWRMNPPRVTVDNISSHSTTLLKVDSPNRHSMLLEVVQILSDLDLQILKAYISSDCGWFMDVFHVTDASGRKVIDEKMISCIEKSICATHELSRRVGILPRSVTSQHTVVELTGTDRPGLMSEISALLLQMHCNVVAAELWTHKRRVACLLYVTDQTTGGPIVEQSRLFRIKDSLSNVLQGNQDSKNPRTSFTSSVTHTERRLHQMMFADRDYERDDSEDSDGELSGSIMVDDCGERGYSVVHIQCRNRPKLVFDTVCTLTDMQYVVFHATIDIDGENAYQEYYIRHIDGCTVDCQAERRRLAQCLRAAIQRRVSEGLKLELCCGDRVGLLSDVTRLFREYGLSVTRADVSTINDKAINSFYVTDASGNPVDVKAIEAVRRELGQAILKATEEPSCAKTSLSTVSQSRPKFSLVNWFGMPSQVLFNLGLIKSCS